MDKKRKHDERQCKRHNVSFTVSCKVDSPFEVRMLVGDRAIDASAVDLSESGMAIITKGVNDAVPVFTIVTVTFVLLDASAAREEGRQRSMEIKGEVRSSLFMKEKNAYRLGVHFTNISRDERAFIAHFIKRSGARAQ